MSTPSRSNSIALHSIRVPNANEFSVFKIVMQLSIVMGCGDSDLRVSCTFMEGQP